MAKSRACCTLAALTFASLFYAQDRRVSLLGHWARTEQYEANRTHPHEANRSPNYTNSSNTISLPRNDTIFQLSQLLKHTPDGGHPVSLRQGEVSIRRWYGRTGNNIFQVSESIKTALCLRCHRVVIGAQSSMFDRAQSVIHLRGSDFIGIQFSVDKLNVPCERPRIGGGWDMIAPLTDVCRYDPHIQHHSWVLTRRVLHPDLKHAIAQQRLQNHQREKDAGEEAVVLHMRMGDTLSHRRYQPFPLAYYKAVLSDIYTRLHNDRHNSDMTGRKLLPEKKAQSTEPVDRQHVDMMTEVIEDGGLTKKQKIRKIKVTILGTSDVAVCANRVAGWIEDGKYRYDPNYSDKGDDYDYKKKTDTKPGGSNHAVDDPTAITMEASWSRTSRVFDDVVTLLATKTVVLAWSTFSLATVIGLSEYAENIYATSLLPATAWFPAFNTSKFAPTRAATTSPDPSTATAFNRDLSNLVDGPGGIRQQQQQQRFFCVNTTDFSNLLANHKGGTYGNLKKTCYESYKLPTQPPLPVVQPCLFHKIN